MLSKLRITDVKPASHGRRLCQHDFWRCFYLAQLAEMPPEAVADFWRGKGFEVDGVAYADAALVELLWKKKAYVPVDWSHATIADIEPYLIHHGHNAFAFHRKMLLRANNATFMNSATLLRWMLPIYGLFFKLDDIREVIFPIYRIFIQNFFPNHTLVRVKKSRHGPLTISYMVFIDDLDNFDGIPYNYDLISIEQMRYGPLALGLSPFEDITLISDRRQIPEIIWDGQCRESGQTLLCDGEAIAVKTSFNAFQERHGLDLGSFKVPNRTVWRATRDYICPERKRTVIYKDCVYGSPVYTSIIKHQKTARPAQIPLDLFLFDAENEDRLASPELFRKHQEVLRSLSPREFFRYHASDESISFNGTTLIKGVSAKILRMLLRAFLNEAKCEFEYREFKRSFEISQGQKNSNFEIRFYRLMDKLQSSNSRLKIEKVGRGRFRIETSAVLEFEEVA